MPIRRRLEEAVPVLLPLLDEMMKGLIIPDPEFDRLENIKQFLEEKKHLFSNLRPLEDDILRQFTVLEEEIDNSKYTTTDSQKLDSIEEIFKRITDLISKFQSLPMESKNNLQTEAETEARREISEEWSALKVEDGILKSPAMSYLQLNYDILDLQMKMCLLFFSIFPAKSVIKKRPLVYWWIGEGLVTKTKDRTAMEEGDRIFEELLNKGFLIPNHNSISQVLLNKGFLIPNHNSISQELLNKGFLIPNNKQCNSCAIHSWIRLMLIGIARSSYLFDSDAPAPGAGTISRSMCSPSTDRVSGEAPPANLATEAGGDHDTNRVLTLFNVNQQYLDIPSEWFSRENKIVVLQLGRWQDSAKHHIEVENEEFLKALETKKHLKYLSLRGISRITEIPSTICKLVNLEILDLRACHNLEKLPSNISSLKKLTHLDISECHLLERMPKGLDKLSSLQVLKGFVVTTSRKGPGRLEEVTGLKKLRKLSIFIPSEAYIEDAERSKLKELSNLQILSITWGGGEGRVDGSTEQSRKRQRAIERRSSFASKKDGQVLVHSRDILNMDYLSFPGKLEKLDLWCIPCETRPAWLNPGKLNSLNRLYIRGGKLRRLNFEEYNKWNVRILRLKYLNFNVDKEQLKVSFPRLTYLEEK